MSNLLKGYFIAYDEENERLVDSNDLLEIKIREDEERRNRLNERLSESYGDGSMDEDGFSAGLPISDIDALIAEDQGGVTDTSDYSQTMMVDSSAQAKYEEEIAEAENTLNMLRQEAEGIIGEAQQKAQKIAEEAFQNAHNEGYEAGYNEGMASVEAMRHELDNEAEQLRQDYQNMANELEPLLVDKITEIYERIFKVELSQYKGLVQGLLIDTINGTEGSRSFIVHVSRDDYQAVLENEEHILAETGMLAEDLKIIQDATLSPGGCVVESENGIYDCSLDTELGELKRKLMLLSYR